MSEKKVLLITATRENNSFDRRLQRALEDLGCDVARCDPADASRVLDLVGENRLPVVLK